MRIIKHQGVVHKLNRCDIVLFFLVVFHHIHHFYMVMQMNQNGMTLFDFVVLSK